MNTLINELSPIQQINIDNDNKINNNNLPNTLLQAKLYSVFITIPQTTIDYTILHNDIINKLKHTDYLITKLETHEDGGFHIHILFKTKQQIRISALHKIIMSQSGNIGGLVDYRKIQKLHASINYIKKEDTSIEDKPYLEYGNIPIENGSNQYKKKNNEEYTQSLLNALEKASEGLIEESLTDIKNIDPMKYILYKDQIKQTLNTENKTRLKYELPSFKEQDVKLTDKQQLVWDLLQETPKTRRIIWVSGDYGSGKSFLYNYINSNHKYGFYNAGSSASMDNVVYGYDEEGVIAWDLPRTFDFNTLGNSISAVIEKFSDFGQSISSKKYNGKTQFVRGHCIVFSNSPPLETLKHRDIIHINLSEDKHIDEPVQENNNNNNIPSKNIKYTIIQQQEDEYDEPDFEYMSLKERKQFINKIRQNQKEG